MANPLPGRRIGQIRRRLGIEIWDLAVRIDIPLPTLVAIEAGGAVAAPQALAAAAALGIAIEDLVDPFRLLPGEARWRVTTRPSEPGPAGTARCLPLRMRRRLGAGWHGSDPAVVAREKRMISHRR